MATTANYIDEQAAKLAKECDKYGGSTTRSTCDYPCWDRQMHRMMPQIATKLKSIGYRVTSEVNHGVTDWTIVKEATPPAQMQYKTPKGRIYDFYDESENGEISLATDRGVTQEEITEIERANPWRFKYVIPFTKANGAHWLALKFKVLTVLLFLGFAAMAQSQAPDTSSRAVQCIAVTKTTGEQCKRMTTACDNLCWQHCPTRQTAAKAGTSMPKQSAATQCTGMTKAGTQCRNKTTDATGRCHHHRN